MNAIDQAQNNYERIRLVLDEAGSDGGTAITLKEKLTDYLGLRAHQAITGDLRHMVERGEVHKTMLKKRFRRRRYAVYVLADHYDRQKHGAVEHRERSERSTAANAGRSPEQLRQRIQQSDIASDFKRILRSLETDGAQTCFELEAGLNLDHATASARLSELRRAHFIQKTKVKRKAPGSTRKSSEYALYNASNFDGHASTLFDN